MTKSTRIINCQFAGTPGRTYAYYTDDASIGEGDHVVVASPYGDGPQALGGRLTVVTVVSATETVEGIEKAAKWIVSRVDTTAAAKRKDLADRIAVLDAKIEKARKAAIASMQLATLAAYSPELSDLVTQRRSLEG